MATAFRRISARQVVSRKSRRGKSNNQQRKKGTHHARPLRRRSESLHRQNHCRARRQQAALTTGGWDPTQRIVSLKAGEDSVENDEKIISPLEIALTQANATRRADLDANYKLASASIGGVETALGKDHPLSIDLHQIRGSMSNEPAKPSTT